MWSGRSSKQQVFQLTGTSYKRLDLSAVEGTSLRAGAAEASRLRLFCLKLCQPAYLFHYLLSLSISPSCFAIKDNTGVEAASADAADSLQLATVAGEIQCTRLVAFMSFKEMKTLARHTFCY